MTTHIYIAPSVWERAQTIKGDGACTRLELLAQLDELRAQLLEVEARAGDVDGINFAVLDDDCIGVGAGLRACQASLLDQEAHAEIDQAAWDQAVLFVGHVRRTPRDFIDARDERAKGDEHA